MEVEDHTGSIEGKFALKGLAAGKPAKMYERFAREMEALKGIDHPNVIKIVDHSQPDDSFHYYVMELLAGARPLSKVLGTEDNPMKDNVLRSLAFFNQIVKAIEAWSNSGIVHRDLSPWNVLVLPDLSIKVIDFGICQLDGHETITLIDEGVGTPNYMAPECESGSDNEASAKSDLYSAGKLLWSVMANQMAFSRESPAFTTKSMKKIYPQSPEAWHLHHLFEKTIRSNPAQRGTVDQVTKLIAKVQFLIAGGFTPLELMYDENVCPICGFGKLGKSDHMHMIFGNPNPPGFSSLKCDYCGTCIARDFNQAKTILSKRPSLQ